MRVAALMGPHISTGRWLILAVLALVLTGCASGSSGSDDAAFEPETSLDTADGEAILEARPEGGFSFTGPYGLVGTLVPEEGQWRLVGVLMTPGLGYRVDTPEVVLLKRLPPHAIITVTVNPPKADDGALRGMGGHTIDTIVGAPTDATFELHVKTVGLHDDTDI